MLRQVARDQRVRELLLAAYDLEMVALALGPARGALGALQLDDEAFFPTRTASHACGPIELSRLIADAGFAGVGPARPSR